MQMGQHLLHDEYATQNQQFRSIESTVRRAVVPRRHSVSRADVGNSTILVV